MPASRSRIRVRLPAAFRHAAGGRAELRVEGGTVGEVLEGICRAYPGLAGRLVAPDGRPRRYVGLFVNDEDARQLGGLDAPLDEGDELSIVPAMSGGMPAISGSGPGPESAAGLPGWLPAAAGDGELAALAAVAGLAEESPSAEVCGFVLAGRGVEPPTLVPVRNAAADPAREFAVDPAELLRVLRAVAAEGREITAFYHSHVTGGASLSPLDVAGLTIGGRPVLPGVELWTAAVERGRAVEVRAYRFEGTAYAERLRRRCPFTAR